ncbi:MAG TPA: DUF4178 domain-containing protein [Acidobacteriota bacterium]|nr:DUF4178 domain-containing protein [Acidobacteriota bacterium]
MGLFDFWKKDKKESPDLDPLHDLTLEKMKAGYLVDYDMRTWKVTARHRYDFDGENSLEWQIEDGDQTWFLQREVDDEVYWSLSRKIPIGAIDGEIRKTIIDNDDPPERITYKGQTYYLEESGAGYFFENSQGSGEGFVYWSFVDEAEKHYLTIEQWGETEFEASHGIAVEEYQFTNILPGGEDLS